MTSANDRVEALPAGRNVAAEFVGTTLLMLAGPGLLILGGGSVGRLELALGFALALALSIGVIGAVANPVLSLALFAARQITGRELGADWLGQFGGAVFGAAIVWGLNDRERIPGAATGWDHSGFAGIGTVLVAEFIFTLIVVLVLLLAISREFSVAGVAGFTAAAYALAMLVLVELDGGGANPARSVASAIFADTDPNALGQVWLFVVAPLLGAIGGVVAWLVVDEATIDDTILDDTAFERLTDAVTGDD